jgi:hypothetical protein
VTAEIVLQIFRFGFLLLLWLFIFAAFRVVRADLFGGRAGRVSSVPPRAAAARGGTAVTRPARPPNRSARTTRNAAKMNSHSRSRKPKRKICRTISAVTTSPH